MNVMAQNRLRRRGWTTVMLTFMIALTATIGFCLFDGDHDSDGDHGASPDLCLGMLAASLVVIVLAGLLPSGWAVAYRLEPASVIRLSVPAPPPKSALLA